MSITRAEVLSNRQKWIARLIRPESKKAVGILRSPSDDAMCCLGHGCEAMGFTWKRRLARGRWDCMGQNSLAPFEFVKAVGLYSKGGSNHSGTYISFGELGFETTLAELNDRSSATPQQIGAYLQSVIEGDPDTPLKPLTDYPEVL